MKSTEFDKYKKEYLAIKDLPDDTWEIKHRKKILKEAQKNF